MRAEWRDPISQRRESIMPRACASACMNSNPFMTGMRRSQRTMSGRLAASTGVPAIRFRLQALARPVLREALARLARVRRVFDQEDREVLRTPSRADRARRRCLRKYTYWAPIEPAMPSAPMMTKIISIGLSVSLVEIPTPCQQPRSFAGPKQRMESIRRLTSTCFEQHCFDNADLLDNAHRRCC